MDANIISFIREECLKNAVKYNGKCNPKIIMGNIIRVFPEVRDDMKDLNITLQKISEEINSLSLEDQKQEVLAIDDSFFDKKKTKEKVLKELPNVDLKKGVIMRFAPSPSGPMHIGHVMTGMPTSMYVNKYGGKFILRIEDTNPEKIYVPAYELIPKEAEWIFGNVSEIWIQSDRMDKYYSYAETLIETNNAYVCTCSSEDFKKHSLAKENCPCRKLDVKEQKKRWKNMLSFDGYVQGEAVLRFSSDMTHKNPAMRDFPLARINEEEHPRQGKKYRVWPLMNLSVTVDDIEAGMTHIIRAKEHATNAERQKLIYDALNVKNFPETLFLGRWHFEGLEISCSKTKEKIDNKEYFGWDDIRLPFLAALKRRGYSPDAFRKFVLNVGTTATDKKMTADQFFKQLNAYNKDFIDENAKRFFFIDEYERVVIKNCPEETLHLDLHPTTEMKEKREFLLDGKFLLPQKDIKLVKENELFRLMDCINVRKNNNEFIFDSFDYETFKESNGKTIIHWLPDHSDLVDVEILMPDNTLITGKAETTIRMLKNGEVIQFERFGFCRLDSIQDNKYKFWFAHR